MSLFVVNLGVSITHAAETSIETIAPIRKFRAHVTAA
jgi:hypothetical protein